MKVVLLAGGFGTRLSEETSLKPKPMIEIGGLPILWHIMKIYSYYGFNEFVICLGYKGYVVKEYFANFFLHNSDVTIDLSDNSLDIHNSKVEKWKVTLIDTGENSMTGGRIKRIQPYIGNERFMLTYGDGVARININDLLKSHIASKKYVTMTTVQPIGRFGAITLDQNNQVTSFIEKPTVDTGFINGGFFVLEPEIFKYIDGDNSIWEKEPLEKLANEKQITAYKLNDFWRPMDTLRDKRELENLWIQGNAPWKVWND